jgi:hypothetical protein
VKFPLRLHIALALVAALALLVRFRRAVAVDLLVCIIVNLLWVTFLVNKTARYFSLEAPLFAVALAIAVTAVWHIKPWRYAAAAVVVIVGLSQFAGNVYLLKTFSKADYAILTKDLRSLIPPGTSVYGIITFWMGMQEDHRYFSYDRTPFQYAISELRPDYLILNDRVMVHGSGMGQDDFLELREMSMAFVQRSATLVGRVPSPFYGELEIYRICYSGSGPKTCFTAE